MKPLKTALAIMALALASLDAQPSYTGPVPDGTVIEDAALRRSQYLDRVNEVIDWRIGWADQNLSGMDLRSVRAKLVRQQDLGLCSQRVIALMQSPGTGPFWMLPTVGTAFLGRGLLTTEAQAAILDTWQTTFQQRGDTENHFVMYYTSLYLMAQLYPDMPGSDWFSGKTSAENFEESREFLLHWMDVTTSIARGEYNSTSYIAEYAIPMIYLANWAEDPEMKKRGAMMLDWIFADLAVNSLDGMLRGPNSRTDDTAIMERWNTANSTFYTWLNFNACPPKPNFGAFGYEYAYLAANYEVPEIIYRIAMDRGEAFQQRDLKRSSTRFRRMDDPQPPIYKTSYMTEDYSVGSQPGGLEGGIQGHVWDVTWTVPDPRGFHNSLFSVHPHSSARALQVPLAVYPDTIVSLLYPGGKPSYDEPDKLLGNSPFEQVFQHKDTVVALYDIPDGTRYPQINGFFSKDLTDLTEDPSGWIFARGGATYLAYRPLAGYDWIAHRGYRQIPSTTSGRAYERVDTGSKVLVSPHLKNGTIVQAAAVSEFESFELFMETIRNLPLAFDLDPTPSLKMRTLRGEEIVCTYGDVPTVNGRAVDYSQWKLFEGPYLNAEKGGHRLVLTHGNLRRVIDFNTLSVVDTTMDPEITPAGGDFQEEVEIRISSSSPDATIRYTTNGSDPEAGSSLYDGPFTLTESGLVRARAFETGLEPSDTVTAPIEVWPTQNVGAGVGGGAGSVDFDAGADWSASTADDWITLSRSSGAAGASTIEFDLAASDRVGNRDGVIRIESTGGNVLWISVLQAGAEGAAPVNMSTRAAVGRGANILIPGMVLKGPGLTRLLLRGVGPGLEVFGLEGVLRDPGLAVYSGPDTVASNGDWEEGPEDLSGVFAEVGAFPLSSESRDAAAYIELEAGSYTLHLAGSDGSEGIALAEVYVVRPEAEGSGLVNLSARAVVGSGDRVLVPGFVISGDMNRRVLVRGIGPGLEKYGVTGFLRDPEIEVYTGQDSIGFNLDWEHSDPSALAMAFQEAGAPALDTGAKDAAILLDLSPGAYTAHIRSTDGTLGVALLELFFLD